MHSGRHDSANTAHSSCVDAILLLHAAAWRCGGKDDQDAGSLSVLQAWC